MTSTYPSNIELALYQRGDDWQKIPDSHCRRNPKLWLEFYKTQSFDPPPLPTVTIDAGGVKTVIPKALSIMGMEDKSRGLGITRININARVKMAAHYLMMKPGSTFWISLKNSPL